MSEITDKIGYLFDRAYYKEAAKLGEEHLSHNLADAYFLGLMAQVYNSLKKSELAIEFIDMALALAADNPSYILVKGLIYAGQQKYEDALVYYNKSIEISQFSDMQWTSKAKAEIYLDKNDDALLSLKKALEINPNSVDALILLSIIYEERKIEDSMRYTVNSILVLDPLNSFGHYFAGKIAFKDQRFKDAVNHYQQTLSGKPDSRVAKKEIEAAIKANKLPLFSYYQKLYDKINANRWRVQFFINILLLVTCLFHKEFFIIYPFLSILYVIDAGTDVLLFDRQTFKTLSKNRKIHSITISSLFLLSVLSMVITPFIKDSYFEFLSLLFSTIIIPVWSISIYKRKIIQISVLCYSLALAALGVFIIFTHNTQPLIVLLIGYVLIIVEMIIIDIDNSDSTF